MAKELVKKEEAGLPVPTDFYDEKGVGFEEADGASYAIPFIAVLQRMSPQLNQDDGAYVEGAKAGDFIQTVSKVTYPGKAGISVVPVHFVRLFVEWLSRESGGGFRGTHQPTDPIVESGTRDDTGKIHIDNGNILMDTRYHYCLLLTPDGPEPVIIPFTSSQIKKSKMWLTTARSIKLRGKNGKPFTPPLFSHVYKIISVQESNSKGTWSGVRVSLDRCLDLASEDDRLIYASAKEFRGQVATGQAKIAPEEEVTESTEF